MGWTADFDPAFNNIWDGVTDRITYIPVDTGIPCQIDAVYEPEGQVFGSENTGASKVGLYNIFHIRKKDVPNPQRKDKMILNGVTWELDDIAANGTDHLETACIVVPES